MIKVDEETVTVGQMIEFLHRRLSLEDRPIRLKQMLRNMPRGRPWSACFWRCLNWYACRQFR